MLFVRFGLVFLLIVRLVYVFPKLPWRFKGQRLNGVRPGDGETCEYKVVRGRSEVRKVSLGIAVLDRLRFSVQPETGFDRVSKFLGIAREWQTSDAQFDNRVFILSDDAVLLEALSRKPRLRAAILDLVQPPHRAVLRCSSGSLWVETKGDERRIGTDDEVARDAATGLLHKLKRVREELATIATDVWEARRDPGIRRHNALLAATFAIGIAGVIAFFWQEKTVLPRQVVFDAVWTRGAWLGAFATAALCAVTFVLLRAQSRLHWVLLEILLIAAPGVWLVSDSVAIWQNQHLDRSEPATLEVRVADKRISRGRRRSNTYYLGVERWPDDRVGRSLKVRQSLYNSITPPECVQVTWHKGYLGDPWITEFTPLGHDCGKDF